MSELSPTIGGGADSLSTLREKLAAFDDTLPLNMASTIPGLWYRDAELYELERRRVFLSSWQAVGRTDQFSGAGDFITAEIAGEPIVVTRDKQGGLRAFSNVCRHRAARVVCPAQGKASFFQCRYHGWTYDLTGKLKGTPEFNGVDGFEREKQSLPAWHVATWNQLVFVHAGDGTPPLEDLLSPLRSRVGHLGMERLVFTERREYEIDCNWKVFVDNYLDGGYHVNTLHPALAGVIQYSEYRTELDAQSSVQISPLKGSDERSTPAASVRSGSAAYYWWLFPNLMINLYEGLMDTNVVFPLGPDHCRVVFDFYFADARLPEKQPFIRDSVALAHEIQLEDLAICRDVQQGLASRTYSQGRFSVLREKGGYHFHRLLASALRGDRG